MCLLPSQTQYSLNTRICSRTWNHGSLEMTPYSSFWLVAMDFWHREKRLLPMQCCLLGLGLAHGSLTGLNSQHKGTFPVYKLTCPREKKNKQIKNFWKSLTKWTRQNKISKSKVLSPDNETADRINEKILLPTHLMISTGAKHLYNDLDTYAAEINQADSPTTPRKATIKQEDRSNI